MKFILQLEKGDDLSRLNPILLKQIAEYAVSESLPQPFRDIVLQTVKSSSANDKLHIIDKLLPTIFTAKNTDVLDIVCAEIPTWQPSPPKEEHYHVPSRSDPNTNHEVTFYPHTGYYTCTCAGFTYRGHCRHIEAVRRDQRS